MRHNKSVTLLELLIAIGLLGVMSIGISSITTFSRYQMTSSDRRVQLQHEAALAMEHMAKNVGQAIGNKTQVPVSGTMNTSDCGISYLTFGVRIDSNRNGTVDTGDKIIGYSWDPCANTILYCSDCLGGSCSNCNSGWEIIARRISNFNAANYLPANDYLDNVNITACWDPTNPATCGTTSDNPAVTLKSRIYMPSVSTN